MLGRRVEVVVTEFATGFFFLFRQTIYLLHPSLALHPFSLSLFRSGFSRSIYNIIIIMAIYVVVVVILKHHHITYNIELTFNQLTVHFTTWARKKVKHFFLLLSFPPLLLSSLFILALCLSACLVFFQFLLSLSSLCLCVLSFCKMRFLFQSNLNSPRKKSSQQKLNPSTYSHTHTAAPHTHISITFRYMSILNRYLVQLPWRSISFFLSLSYSDGILFQISFVVPSNALLSFFLVVMWAHECASLWDLMWCFASHFPPLFFLLPLQLHQVKDDVCACIFYFSTKREISF